MRCTATSKRTGKRCGAHAMKGGKVCRHHGGKSLKGIASPAFKHGRWSKYLPTKLAVLYDEARNDPTLLKQQDDLALQDAYISKLLSCLDTGESGQNWKRLQHTYKQLKQALIEKDRDAQNQHFKELGMFIEQGASEYEIWRNVCMTIAERRKTVESERKRYVEMHQMITTERALILIGQIAETIKNHVRDRKVLNAIITDFGKLVNDGFDQPAAG